MNLPNKLTVLRVAMIPLFLACFFLNEPIGLGTGLFNAGYYLALVVFIAASFTDLLDGKIARNRGLITDFGKLMDPLADKLLVMSAMVCLLAAGLVHPVFVILILAREFLVTSIRLVAAARGAVIAADGWGKAKTVCQMFWIGSGLLYLGRGISAPGEIWTTTSSFLPDEILKWGYLLLCAGSVILTVVSGFRYTWNNRALFGDA